MLTCITKLTTNNSILNKLAKSEEITGKKAGTERRVRVIIIHQRRWRIRGLRFIEAQCHGGLTDRKHMITRALSTGVSLANQLRIGGGANDWPGIKTVACVAGSAWVWRSRAGHNEMRKGHVRAAERNEVAKANMWANKTTGWWRDTLLQLRLAEDQTVRVRTKNRKETRRKLLSLIEAEASIGKCW